MATIKEKQLKKTDFEILFMDSSEYFLVENARMIQEGNMVRFICFDENDEFKHDLWYPMTNIFRIKRY